VFQVDKAVLISLTIILREIPIGTGWSSMQPLAPHRTVRTLKRPERNINISCCCSKTTSELLALRSVAHEIRVGGSVKPSTTVTKTFDGQACGTFEPLPQHLIARIPTRISRSGWCPSSTANRGSVVLGFSGLANFRKTPFSLKLLYFRSIAAVELEVWVTAQRPTGFQSEGGTQRLAKSA